MSVSYHPYALPTTGIAFDGSGWKAAVRISTGTEVRWDYVMDSLSNKPRIFISRNNAMNAASLRAEVLRVQGARPHA